VFCDYFHAVLSNNTAHFSSMSSVHCTPVLNSLMSLIPVGNLSQELKKWAQLQVQWKEYCTGKAAP